MDAPARSTEVLAAAGVRFAYLFGSRATGTHRPDSDADVAVMTDRPLTLLQEAGLAVELADALGVLEVDLVDLRTAPLRLLGRILADAVVLCGHREPARVEFEVRTRSRYFDFLPMQRATQEAYVRRVAAEGLRG